MNHHPAGLRLPHNRRPFTEPVSLAEASRPLARERTDERGDGLTVRCHWCGEKYVSGSGPVGGYCTDVCWREAGQP